MSYAATQLNTCISRDHTTSLEDAIASVRRHLDTLDVARPGDRCGSFHSEQVLALLDQPGCVAVRMYPGRKQSSYRTVVLTGVAADGVDLVDGILMQEWMLCPPYCPIDAVILGLAKQGEPYPYPARPLTTRDHTVTAASAAGYIDRHRAADATTAETDEACTFDAEQVRALLGQAGCTGLRIYHARTHADEAACVLAAMQHDGSDITDGVLMLEQMEPCARFGAVLSALQS